MRGGPLTALLGLLGLGIYLFIKACGFLILALVALIELIIIGVREIYRTLRKRKALKELSKLQDPPPMPVKSKIGSGPRDWTPSE